MWFCRAAWRLIIAYVLGTFFSMALKTKKILPKLATGEWIGAWGLTEANTGSDAMRMKCVAEKDGDHWIINGTRTGLLMELQEMLQWY